MQLQVYELLSPSPINGLYQILCCSIDHKFQNLCLGMAFLPMCGSQLFGNERPSMKSTLTHIIANTTPMNYHLKMIFLIILDVKSG